MPSAVLPTAGRSRSGVLPHSQTDSTPNAAAVRTIEPTLNGWLTESSSSASRPSVRRRHSRLSRFTSVGRSCRGGPLAPPARAAGTPCDPARQPARQPRPPEPPQARRRCHWPSEGSLARSGSSGPVTRSRRYPLRADSRVTAHPSSFSSQPCSESAPRLRPITSVAAALRREAGQPAAQHGVQRPLADPDRRVGPDAGQPQGYLGRVGRARSARWTAPRSPRSRRKGEGALVDVDRPDRVAPGRGPRARTRSGRSRSPGRGCRPTRAAVAPSVEQQPRARVEAARREHRPSRWRAPGTGRAAPRGPGRDGARRRAARRSNAADPVTGSRAAATAGRTRRRARARCTPAASTARRRTS